MQIPYILDILLIYYYHNFVHQKNFDNRHDHHIYIHILDTYHLHNQTKVYPSCTQLQIKPTNTCYNEAKLHRNKVLSSKHPSAICHYIFMQFWYTFYMYIVNRLTQRLIQTTAFFIAWIKTFSISIATPFRQNVTTIKALKVGVLANRLIYIYQIWLQIKY